MDVGFDNATSGSAVEHLFGDIVEVDLLAEGPGRGRITRHLPNPDIDEAALGTFPSHSVADEFEPGQDPHSEVEGEWFAPFILERGAVLGLQTMRHANDWFAGWPTPIRRKPRGVFFSANNQRRHRKIGSIEMCDDGSKAAEALGGAAANQYIVVFVGGIGLRFSAAGKDDPFGTPLAGIGTRPARKG